jgi:sRNA-binding protein
LYDAIGFHVNSIKYLNRIRTGAPRFNLWGKPDGKVTEAESNHARKRMVELHSMYLRAKRKNKKQGVIVNQKVGRGMRQKTTTDKSDKPKRVLTLNKTK